MDIHEKVEAIFREMVGERADNICASTCASKVQQIISSAMRKEEYDQKTSDEIALHMSDWNADAAFIVALHLFPEKFSDKEIEEGVECFLWHAPWHIAEACKFTGIPGICCDE